MPGYKLPLFKNVFYTVVEKTKVLYLEPVKLF
ncbi:hypothetical protein [Paenimyroides ceti]